MTDSEDEFESSSRTIEERKMVIGGPRERESNPRRPVLVARNHSSIVLDLDLDLDLDFCLHAQANICANFNPTS
jgi:hypothetical protein